MRTQSVRSLTFWLGVILALAAFCAFLFLGHIFNPPPTHVVVLTRDVPRYGVITRDMLGVDAQVLHPDLARAYVLEDEVVEYLGAVVIEPLYAGDPLTKTRLIVGEQAVGLQRLDQADQVAMVIPVKPETRRPARGASGPAITSTSSSPWARCASRRALAPASTG